MSEPSDHPNTSLPVATRRLTLAEARGNPCDTCATAPCCTHLPLHTFQIHNLQSLDHAIYLLNFQRIELGLSAAGDWSVYYRYPCRFLDRDSRKCTVYRTEWQPSICVHYNPYACWYRHAYAPGGDPTFLRVNRERMELIAERLVFDEYRNIVETPDWKALLEQVAQIPIDPAFDDEFADDPVWDEWLLQSGYGTSAPEAAPGRYGYGSFSDRCAGCQAYCCKTLVFPHGSPTVNANLDYIQFVLGFPGIEMGISDDGWVLVVKTVCRHLSDDRCSIFGRPERPMICSFYDASTCNYVVQFGESRPRDFFRIRLQQFPWMVEVIEMDRHGNVSYIPRTEELRRHVERRWQEALADAEVQLAQEGSASADASGADGASVASRDGAAVARDDTAPLGVAEDELATAAKTDGEPGDHPLD